MPEKYIRHRDLPLLIRHTGRTTLPEIPPIRSQGTTVLCLHDAGLQSSVFEDLLRALEAEGANAVAFDLPGHGRSGGLDSLASIEAMAESARHVGDWCQLDELTLVGHGMGAWIALEWARSDLSSVAEVVLCGVGASLAIDDETIEQMRRVTRGQAPRPFDPGRVCKDSGPDLMRRAYMEGLQTDPRATLVDLEASRAWLEAFTGDPGTIGCPVRIFCGSAECDADRRHADEFCAAVAKGSTASPIEAAAHFLPLEQPAAFAKEILNGPGHAAVAS